MTRFRRNINCLSSDQLHDLREAFATLYAYPEASPHGFLTIAGDPRSALTVVLRARLSGLLDLAPRVPAGARAGRSSAFITT